VALLDASLLLKLPQVFGPPAPVLPPLLGCHAIQFPVKFFLPFVHHLPAVKGVHRFCG